MPVTSPCDEAPTLQSIVHRPPSIVQTRRPSDPFLKSALSTSAPYRPLLKPVVVLIDATDRLIDLIVYRLYGLTADEVAVVEGNR